MDAEVCIVGAGAAGGILALSSPGAASGSSSSSPVRGTTSRRGEYVRRYLRHENPWRPPLELDRYTVGGTPVPPRRRRARGVGGSTLHWEGYTLRLHANDFRLRSLYGMADDWPISYQDLETLLRAAERMLGVAGAADEPWASSRSTPFPFPPFPSATPTACSRPRAGPSASRCITCRRRATRSRTRAAAVPAPAGPARLSDGRQGQHRPDPHPGGRGDGQRPGRHRGDRPRLEIDRSGAGQRRRLRGPRQGRAAADRAQSSWSRRARWRTPASCSSPPRRTSRRGWRTAAGWWASSSCRTPSIDVIGARAEKVIRIASGSRPRCRGSSRSSAIARPAAPSSWSS